MVSCSRIVTGMFRWASGLQILMVLALVPSSALAMRFLIKDSTLQDVYKVELTNLQAQGNAVSRRRQALSDSSFLTQGTGDNGWNENLLITIDPVQGELEDSIVNSLGFPSQNYMNFWQLLLRLLLTQSGLNSLFFLKDKILFDGNLLQSTGDTKVENDMNLRTFTISFLSSSGPWTIKVIFRIEGVDRQVTLLGAGILFNDQLRHLIIREGKLDARQAMELLMRVIKLNPLPGPNCRRPAAVNAKTGYQPPPQPPGSGAMAAGNILVRARVLQKVSGSDQLVPDF